MAPRLVGDSLVMGSGFSLRARTKAKMLIDMRSGALRFLKFIGSGSVAAIVHTSIMFALLHFGLGPHKSFLVGFTCGVIVRFFVDRNLVFYATSDDARMQFVRYAAAAIAAYFVSATLFYLFLDVFRWHQVLSFGLAVVSTTFVAYGLVTLALRGYRKTVA